MSKINSCTKNESQKTVSDAKNPSSNSWTAYIFGVAAALSSACGNFFLKVTEEDKTKAVLLRMLIQYLILIPFMTFRKIDFVINDWTTNAWILLRAGLSSVVMISLGYSMEYLPLGDAMALFYTYPVLVVFFACICLKEKCGFLNIGLTVITMAGFLLVAQPSAIFGHLSDTVDVHKGDSRIYGVLLAFLASVSGASISVIIRKLGHAVHFSQSLLFVSWEGVIIVVVFMGITGQSPVPCFSSFPALLGCAAGYFCGQIFRTLALQRGKAGPITLIQTSQVVFSFLLQYIFLDEIPNMLCAIGASLILFSCVVLAAKSIVKAMRTKS